MLLANVINNKSRLYFAATQRWLRASLGIRHLQCDCPQLLTGAGGSESGSRRHGTVCERQPVIGC